MDIFNKINFSGCNIYNEVLNKNSKVFIIENSNDKDLNYYKNYFVELGFIEKEERLISNNIFIGFLKDNIGVFINYFININRISIVVEKECLYFDYIDNKKDILVSSTITQVSLEDYGMSYCIRTSDCRFIVIDGGREFETDAKRLYECMKDQSDDEIPVIALWILTHPHADHYQCFIKFYDLYKDKVKIEKFLFNFPENNDFYHYPGLKHLDFRFTDCSEELDIPRMLERINESNALVYTAHTGQKYYVGDVKLEILSSMDDTICFCKYINSASLVIRMEIENTVILWTADVMCDLSRLADKYRQYLKSDILQIPHHGFQSGNALDEIKCYDLISPKVCFLPVSDYNCYTVINSFRESTRYIFNLECVDEIITGDNQKTITLPYYPKKEFKKDYYNKYLNGVRNNGSNVWVFNDLHTSDSEDFIFTILNMTHFNIEVYVELFFEDPDKEVRFIKFNVNGRSIKTVNIIKDVDDDALYFNWLSLKIQGVVENAPFAVRFMSDKPVVITHKKHKANFY